MPVVVETFEEGRRLIDYQRAARDAANSDRGAVVVKVSMFG